MPNERWISTHRKAILPTNPETERFRRPLASFLLVSLTMLCLVPLLSACRAKSPSAEIEAQRAPVSPLVQLLRDGGIGLSDEAKVSQQFTIALDGLTYQVLEWRNGSEKGLQIAKDAGLVSDSDQAYRVLLSYAWTAEYHGLDDNQRNELHDFHARIRSAGAQYDQVFSAAESISPILEAIDDLKDRTIDGVPTVEIGGLTLLEVHNMWDLVCTIPVNVADACLLEPLLREFNKKSAEVEKLLLLADTALTEFLGHLDAQAQGQIVEGQRLKESAERTIAALRNLSDALLEFNGTVRQIEEMSADMATALRNPKLPGVVTGTIAWLQRWAPDLDVTGAMLNVAGRLDGLSNRLAGVRERTLVLEAEIGELSIRILSARLRSEESLRGFGAQWRPPETNHNQ